LRRIMQMAVYFKCDLCGGEHRSAVQFSKDVFDDPGSSASGNSQVCPATGKMVAPDKSQMHWRDEPAKDNAPPK
jgi:hypothetical protein